MRGSVLSQRYAEALADVVEAHGELERVRDELNALAAELAHNRAMQLLVATAARSRSSTPAVGTAGKLENRTVTFPLPAWASSEQSGSS